jgi:predicted phosphodiesterase
MRALVLSDIHANLDALDALDRVWRGRYDTFDRVIVLGDLVDYGPCPRETIAWVQAHATDVVAGNHDEAMATGGRCGSSARFLAASIATRERLRPTLTADELAYLGALPRTATITDDDRVWQLVHATPRDPLLEYLRPNDAPVEWRAAFERRLAPYVLVGHTHLPFVHLLDHGGLVVNPGSLGMPKDRHPSGSYAIVDGASVEFRRVTYDVDRLIGRLARLDLPDTVVEVLIDAFRNGR